MKEMAMRRLGLASLTGLGMALVLVGCPRIPDLCDDNFCEAPDGAASSSGSTDAKDDRGTIDAPPGCDLTKSPKDSPNCVDESVAVFVSPTGNDTADGKKASPVRNIGKGVELAAARGLPRVYVCEGSYDVAVEVRAPIAIHGGLSCAWAVANVKPKLAPSKGVALTVSKVAAAVLVEDLEIVGSADAATPGDSAIAAFVSESNNVTFRNVNLTAKDGVAGGTGAGRSNYSGAAKDGSNASGATGGLATSCACTDTTSSTGGAGASGAGVGTQDGTSSPAVGGPNAGLTGPSACTDGQIGANGLAGGAGTAPTSPGTLAANGWNSLSGGPPAPNGRPGQGGGGGGAKTNFSQAGGGGGCGGCGGGGGASGNNGGSSFALLVYKSTIGVESGGLTTGAAGRGGDGGPGQAGQSGGAAGGGSCNGGPGGSGSGGSGGGGGAGGHSVPVAWVGTEPLLKNAQTTPGTKGSGGGGGTPGAGPGNAGTVGTTGPDGKAQASLELP